MRSLEIEILKYQRTSVPGLWVAAIHGGGLWLGSYLEK